ncbi:hypothetical protein [Halomonas sp.]|uniref:hypothetical protein n=1 Tax=Halomonas sp. TaxID=1486246 RepID=UPI00298E0808|nr:hypothetical protein [Halomonas sp.]MDW7746840.1 hypothetical protein [Halomonas sp.]
MKLEDIIQERIEEHLDTIGHEEPLPDLDEPDAKKLIFRLAFAEFRELEYIDARESSCLYKALIDLIRARQGEEISFRKKHMFD